MKKIIAFSGSNSKKSINKQLAKYASSLVENLEVEILDLIDFPLPIYGIDTETENGTPKNASKFLNEIKNADGVIVSLAEHNGNFTVAFKNLYDWMSRVEQKLWNNKPLLVMATSPGGRGGASVIEIAKNSFPHMGGNVVANFSLPNFYDNFKEGIISEDNLRKQLKDAVLIFENSI